jgi:hypothetical protein
MSDDVELLARLADARRRLLRQVGLRIVGQHEVLDGILPRSSPGGTPCWWACPASRRR